MNSWQGAILVGGWMTVQLVYLDPLVLTMVADSLRRLPARPPLYLRLMLGLIGRRDSEWPDFGTAVILGAVFGTLQLLGVAVFVAAVREMAVPYLLVSVAYFIGVALWIRYFWRITRKS